MIIDVYIGLSNDPSFKWEGGDWNGNIPKRITPTFPCAVHRSSEDLHPGSPLSYENTYWVPACKDFGLELVQLDWGAFGAKINKSQILDLIKRFAPDASDELMTAVNSLDKNTEYALITAEQGGGVEMELDE